MPSLTLKNIPEELLERLRALAQRRRRSVNSEAIAILEAAVQPATPVDVEALISRLRSTRVTPRRPLTEQMLNRFKREGRL
jgi:plasmid stability protein